MLDRGNGMVLKALQTPPRGTRELGLYQAVFDPACADTDVIQLRNFLPIYYGTELVDDGIKKNYRFV
jgi:1D-myo-inositol-tetrakisphosphate 5-kinase/inositol-polyphosphate multikinase